MNELTTLEWNEVILVSEKDKQDEGTEFMIEINKKTSFSN